MATLDPIALRDQAGKLLLEWKVMVFKRKMSLKEYDMRRAGLLDLFRRMNLPEPGTVGWVALRRKLQERDPDLEIPEEVKPRAYRGKY